MQPCTDSVLSNFKQVQSAYVCSFCYGSDAPSVQPDMPHGHTRVDPYVSMRILHSPVCVTLS